MTDSCTQRYQTETLRQFYMILSLATLIPDHSKVFFPLTRLVHFVLSLA
jgi:hypothetical protein